MKPTCWKTKNRGKVKIRLPLFDPDEAHPIPASLEEIAASMRQKYDTQGTETENLVVEGKGSGF